MNTYLGFVGFLLNNPIIKLQTFGCLLIIIVVYLPAHGKLIRLIYIYNNRSVFNFFLKQLC